MPTNRIVAGVDVSKERLAVTFFDGNQDQSFNIPYTQKSFNKLINPYKTKPIHVVCEATGNYHLRLAKFSQDAGFLFSSVNPFIIKRYSDIRMTRAKTDKIDSGLIARYGYDFEPISNLPISPARKKMKQLLKAIEDIHQVHQIFEIDWKHMPPIRRV